jgi:hypothetical protein
MTKTAIDATHVYAATCGPFVKIGVSSGVPRRMRGLSGMGHGRARLVKAWEHADAYRIEGAAIVALANKHQRAGREWFTAQASEVVDAVEAAIADAANGVNVAITKKEMAAARRKKRDAEYVAAWRRVHEVAEQAVRDHPEQVATYFPGTKGRKHASKSAIHRYFDAKTIADLQEEGRRKRRRK